MIDLQSLELLEFKVSRRAFLGGGAGLTFAFTLGRSTPREASAQAPGGAQVLNAYVSIAPDGTITIQSQVAEMGQGIMTGLPLIVAEELTPDVPIAPDRLVLASSVSLTTTPSASVLPALITTTV